ncbi:MAG: SemiSWEET transporter [Myxococcota bacterium]|jgi:MtN3 and saliva related transmembrane protein|nr:SemiSWEET transporter [Myxococcota bacterium]
MAIATELLGIVAGSLTTLSFVPQVLKVYRERRADDLSLGMFLAFCLGVALWIVYGVLIASAAVIIANVITFFLSAAIVVAKLRFSAS